MSDESKPKINRNEIGEKIGAIEVAVHRDDRMYLNQGFSTIKVENGDVCDVSIGIPGGPMIFAFRGKRYSVSLIDLCKAAFEKILELEERKP